MQAIICDEDALTGSTSEDGRVSQSVRNPKYFRETAPVIIDTDNREVVLMTFDLAAKTIIADIKSRLPL